jgi:transposase
LYINRYNSFGIESLLRDKTRKPGKEPISQDIKDEICRLVCNEKPKNETHWGCRTLAKRVGIGHTSVNRILGELGLQPHIVKNRNYSKDPDFESKLKDVVGLYIKPPENEIILCVNTSPGTKPADITINTERTGTAECRLSQAWDDNPVCGIGCTQVVES